MAFPNLDNKVLASAGSLDNLKDFRHVVDTTLTSSQVWDFNITTVIPAGDLAKYDLTKLRLAVYFLHASGYWMAADSTTSFGFNNSGAVRVINDGAGDVTYRITMVVPRIPV